MVYYALSFAVGMLIGVIAGQLSVWKLIERNKRNEQARTSKIN